MVSLTHQQNTHFLDALIGEEDHHFDTTKTSSIQGQEQDEELTALLHKEGEKEQHRNLEQIPSLAKARREVVQWMLRVVAYFSFSSLTAVLAVTYLDRFLHMRFQPLTDNTNNNKPWMFQLVAVACLSLAAKVNETHVHVPLLLDLQVEEPKYVFEPKNIQKMEILVLSTLDWKMNSVTPISFLDYIERKLNLCEEFLTRCERLILSILTDTRFMAYLPSTMATATMVHVITNIHPSIALENHDLDRLLGILGINKDRVRDCCILIDEANREKQIEVEVVKLRHNNLEAKYPTWPGLLNAPTEPQLSQLHVQLTDKVDQVKTLINLRRGNMQPTSSNDSWAIASNSSSVSSSPHQPHSKKIKIQKKFNFN